MSWPVHSRRKPAWRLSGETSTNALPTARRTRPVWADMRTSVLMAPTGAFCQAVLARGDDPPGTPRWPAARFLRHRAVALLARGDDPPGTPRWPAARFLRH